MSAVTPGETLGTLYNIHVGSNKTKQHTAVHSTATVHMYAWQIADALASGDAHIDQPRSRAGEAALSHHSTRAARTHVVKPLMRAH